MAAWSLMTPTAVLGDDGVEGGGSSSSSRKSSFRGNYFRLQLPRKALLLLLLLLVMFPLMFFSGCIAASPHSDVAASGNEDDEKAPPMESFLVSSLADDSYGMSIWRTSESLDRNGERRTCVAATMATYLLPLFESPSRRRRFVL